MIQIQSQVIYCLMQSFPMTSISEVDRNNSVSPSVRSCQAHNITSKQEQLKTVNSISRIILRVFRKHSPKQHSVHFLITGHFPKEITYQ
jgi:hypothetical protein